MTTSPHQPNTPQNPPSNTPSGGATPHEQSQWIIRTINDFTGKIGKLEVQHDGVVKDIKKIEDDTGKISDLSCSLAGQTSWIKAMGIAISTLVLVAGWAGTEIYKFNGSQKAAAEKMDIMAKDLEQAKKANSAIIEKLDQLLESSKAPPSKN